jgi:hypothetical protein
MCVLNNRRRVFMRPFRNIEKDSFRDDSNLGSAFFSGVIIARDVGSALSVVVDTASRRGT